MSSSRVVAITGAAGAIGGVVAQHFAEAGWTLALLDYGTENAGTLRQKFPEAHVSAADLTDAKSARQAIRAIENDTSGIEVLLNVAGGFAMQPAPDATADDLAKMHQLNFVTLFNTTRAVLPHMQERGRGVIIGVSAAAALHGAPGAALYAASKAGVAAYVQSLHAELREEGVRATVVYPMGVVDTPANRSAMPDADPDTWIAREEVAESMLHAATRSPRGHLRELKIFAPSVDE